MCSLTRTLNVKNIYLLYADENSKGFLNICMQDSKDYNDLTEFGYRSVQKLISFRTEPSRICFLFSLSIFYYIIPVNPGESRHGNILGLSRLKYLIEEKK